ncbi:MAG: purine-nucleoside phosphorylase [Planctomycetaceae bacterium]|nr:purine-nucleoside phosphorylase [Planctomycetaceae bacterium]MCB9952000.1 purine-nucleoside phosphorylase [Planctomycetaceae bacterium]
MLFERSNIEWTDNSRHPTDDDCAAAIRLLSRKLPMLPRAAVVLGSGLGKFVNALRPICTLSYSDIPGFPVPTATGHAGKLHLVDLLGLPVAVLQGRCHRYEGHSSPDVTRVVRTMLNLGIEQLIVSCAAGGLNPRFRAGDIMLFDSHIDFLGAHCSQNGPVLHELYPSNTVRHVERVALDEQILLRRGTYIAVPGPNYETRAELRFLRSIGGDAIGMSSIPELLEARRRGINAIGLAAITNECRPDAPETASAEAVIAEAEAAEPRFRKLVLSLLARMATVDSAVKPKRFSLNSEATPPADIPQDAE